MFGLAIIAKLAFAAQVAAAPAPKDGKVIVRLVSRHNDISIVSTGGGVRYSAVDKAGHTIISKATLDELKAKHPDLYRLVTPILCSTDAPVPYAGIASAD